MSDARHPRDVQIVLVPVPVGGSNEPIRQVKPRYPQQQRRDPWRPQRAIPSKAQASVSLLRRMVEQEAAVREMLRPQHR
jgi:hypothetical protein